MLYLTGFQPPHPALPFLSLLKVLSQCCSLCKSCEILSGKPARTSLPGGHFPSESQIFGSSLVQHVAIGRASPLSLCTPPSGHLSPLKPSAFFFFPPIFRNSLPNECWPIPVPSYKNRPRWPKMLRECGYYCTYTHTCAGAPLQ